MSEGIKHIFPELGGFALVNIDLAESILSRHETRDVLSLLQNESTASEFDEANAILPIFDVEDGLYSVSVISKPLEDVLGKICTSGVIGIIGIGYLTNFSREIFEKHGVIAQSIQTDGIAAVSYYVDLKNEIVSLGIV